MSVHPNSENQLTSPNNLPVLAMLNLLAKQGYIAHFKVTMNGIQALGVDRTFESEKVKIIDTYTIINDPEIKEDCLLYTIETNDGTKGTLLHIAGTENLRDINSFVRKVIEKK